MGTIERFYEKKYKLREKPVFPLIDILRARSEFKYGLCEVDKQKSTVKSPQIDKFRLRHEAIMGDIYLHGISPIRENTERAVTYLRQKEEPLSIAFYRSLNEDIIEASLRVALEALVECKGEITQRLSDLNGQMLYYLDLLLRVYERYSVRTSKYISRLSKRYRCRLYQGYTKDDFEIIGKLQQEQLEVSKRLSQEEAKIDIIRDEFDNCIDKQGKKKARQAIGGAVKSDSYRTMNEKNKRKESING